MQSYQAKAPSDKPNKSNMVLPLAIGGGAFVVGAIMAFGYVQWNSQKQQLSLMTQMIEQMGQQAEAPQAAPLADTVTRGEQVNLLEVSTTTSAAPVVAEPVAPAPVAAVAAVAPAPTETDELGQSTADKLRSLVATSVAPSPTPTLDEKTIANAKRLETLAIIHAGVQELVAAVVAGNYDIHTNYEDENFSGRIHFAFVGHEEDQTALEAFLSKAAEAGIIAHSNSVVDPNGKVNGHILLFDLVERALENGTLVEQQAGAKMRREAVALLAKDATVGQAVTNASGDRFYTVESGDSLAFIALQFYGNTNSYTRIFEANRSQLRTPDRIRVGQRLVIPQA